MPASEWEAVRADFENGGNTLARGRWHGSRMVAVAISSSSGGGRSKRAARERMIPPGVLSWNGSRNCWPAPNCRGGNTCSNSHGSVSMPRCPDDGTACKAWNRRLQNSATAFWNVSRCSAYTLEAEPTPRPVSGGSFSGHILAEGGFCLRWRLLVTASCGVTDQLIRRWLPTTLFARMSGDLGET